LINQTKSSHLFWCNCSTYWWITCSGIGKGPSGKH